MITTTLLLLLTLLALALIGCVLLAFQLVDQANEAMFHRAECERLRRESASGEDFIRFRLAEIQRENLQDEDPADEWKREHGRN